jgi:hypothetical protein
VGQTGGIVAIGISTGDGEHTLTKQIIESVDDLARLAVITQTFGQLPGQAELLVGSAQQNRSAIRAGVRFVELGNERPTEKISERDRLLHGRLAQAKASGVAKVVLANTFYHMEAFVFLDFVNYPG